MRTLVVLCLAAWISGCATNAPLKEISQDGPSTAEIIKGLDNSKYDAAVRKRQSMKDYSYSGYTRNAENELQVLFPRLPNPTLIMYVTPHLSASGDPVPGYSTAFPLYDRYHYALPGETQLIAK